MRWIAVASVLIAGGVILASAVGDEDGSNPSRAASLGLLEPALATGRPIVVTGRRAPTGRCGARSVAAGVVALTEAMNRGDVAAIRKYLAPEPMFQWFAVNEIEQSDADLRANRVRGRGAFEAADHRGLLRWIARRHRAGERLALRTIAVNRMRPGSWFPEVRRDAAGFEFAMRRTAPDLPSGPETNSLAEGKGGIECLGGRLFVWSSALNVRAMRDRAWLCPPPPAGTPRRAVVACRIGG